MPKITKLRQCLETLKTPFLIETVESLQAEDKIIIFCEYMSTVNAMHDAFAAAGIKAVRLVGADSATKRQRAIDTFQDDPEVRVFIGTTMAAGVGITLTAANYVAFASMPWTPALMRQAEDRAYRLGQQRATQRFGHGARVELEGLGQLHGGGDGEVAMGRHLGRFEGGTGTGAGRQPLQFGGQTSQQVVFDGEHGPGF